MRDEAVGREEGLLVQNQRAPEARVGVHLCAHRLDPFQGLPERDALFGHEHGEYDGARARDAILAVDEANAAALARLPHEAERLLEARQDLLRRLVRQPEPAARDARLSVRSLGRVKLFLGAEVEHVRDSNVAQLPKVDGIVRVAQVEVGAHARRRLELHDVVGEPLVGVLLLLAAEGPAPSRLKQAVDVGRPDVTGRTFEPTRPLGLGINHTRAYDRVGPERLGALDGLA